MPTSVSNRNPPRCALVCVGSELLNGKLNTHASYISRQLSAAGWVLAEETTVGDELPQISEVIRRNLRALEVVIVSGGLGPTFDDLTREGAAEATGRSLVLSDRLLEGIRKKFRRARYRMPKANARQAYLLEGASAIANHVGTAPGQWLVSQGKILVLLPGPPRELYPMWETFVMPRLRKLSSGLTHLASHMHFVGVPESVVDARIRPIIARAGETARFTILAHLGLVDLDIVVSDASAARARRTLARITTAVRRAVGVAWYGSDDDFPLERVVGNHFRRKRATLAVAESCTGGLLAARLTDIPGSSDYFLEGWVTYANSAKIRDLGVPETLIRKQGAVSRPVAIAMAEGIRQRAGSTWGVGITGIAGPGGPVIRRKPVGLVFIALSSKNRSVCQEFHFSGDRETVRQRAVLAVLEHLRRI